MTTSSSSLFSLFLHAAGTSASLGRLIEDIDTLNRRLAHPDQQSDYFRWGLRNHTERFRALCAEYRRIRNWYNAQTVDNLLEERTLHLHKARSLAAGHMNMGRALQVNAAMAQIRWLDECLRLKEGTPAMPALEELLTGSAFAQMP